MGLFLILQFFELHTFENGIAWQVKNFKIKHLQIR